MWRVQSPRMDIQYTFSDSDLEEIRALLNAFLEHLSLDAFARWEVGLADSHKLGFGRRDEKYSGVEKVINRWGIRCTDGKYYLRLNELIGRISAQNRMLQIYEPIQLFLFSKLLEGWWEGKRLDYTLEELRVFFLQPYKMLCLHSICGSGVSLYDLIRRTLSLSPHLRNDHAKRYLNEGVSRRLRMLKVTVDSISEIYRQSRVEPMNDDETARLSQNVNFFYANIYAIIDCLAFVFAYEDPEYNLDGAHKRDLKEVSLFRSAFSRHIRGLDEKLSLSRLKPWYNDIVDLRHPVAHRIPLYFPDILVGEEGQHIQTIEEEYWKDFNRILADRAALPDDATNSLETLMAEREEKRDQIRVFSGCFLHSLSESNKVHHLSRLVLDLAILYHLVDTSFNLLVERNREG